MDDQSNCQLVLQYSAGLGLDNRRDCCNVAKVVKILP